MLTGNLKVRAERICDVTGLPAGGAIVPAYNGITAWINGGPPLSSVQGCFQIGISSADLTAALGASDSLILPIAFYIDAEVKGNPIPATYTWISTLGGNPPCGMSIVYYDTLKVYRLMGLDDAIASAGFTVDDNYPNPFSGSTQINYHTVKEEPITFSVYNMLGALVYQQNYHSSVGNNSITFTADGLSSGIYTYAISNGKHTYMRKMLID